MAQRLAIDRNHLTAGDFVDRRNELQQALLKFIELDRSQDRIEAIATKSSAPQSTAQMAIVTTLING